MLSLFFLLNHFAVEEVQSVSVLFKQVYKNELKTFELVLAYRHTDSWFTMMRGELKKRRSAFLIRT